MRALVAQPKQTQDAQASLGVATMERQGGASSSAPIGLRPSSPKQAACAGTLACSWYQGCARTSRHSRQGEIAVQLTARRWASRPWSAVRPRTASPPRGKRPHSNAL